MSSIFIIGAPKCGTTYLHNAIGVNCPKEPLFFNTYQYEEKCMSNFIDANSHNHIMKFVPKRIKANCVDVKIIMLVRDRAERAYSNWSMRYKYDKYERLSFEDAMIQNLESFDENIFQTVESRMKTFDGINDNIIRTYIEQGLYWHNVSNYIKEFGVNNVLIVNILKDGLKKVEDFLEIKLDDTVDQYKGDYEKKNIYVNDDIRSIWENDQQKLYENTGLIV